MKTLLALVAIIMVSSQAGYCAAPALESLELMGNTKGVSAALQPETALKPAAVQELAVADCLSDITLVGIRNPYIAQSTLATMKDTCVASKTSR